MAITKEIELTKMDSDAIIGAISVRVDTVIKEDGTEIGRSVHRHVVAPFNSVQNTEGAWTHTPWDLDTEESQVKAVATALWTDSVKTAWKTKIEARAASMPPE